MRPVIILFAKAPVPGRVKTRLQPDLTPEQSAGLHRAFVRDTLDMLQGMAPVADLELHTDTSTDAWKDVEVARQLQVAGDLGARMYHALHRGLEAGRPRAMIVGSDAPTLPAAHLAELLHLDADVSIGPSEDGGYYAIAARRVEPLMFAGVEWSASQACAGTVAACRACGLTVAMGKTWFDVDTTAELPRLAASPALPPHTQAWLLQHSKDRLSAPDEG
jgi:uncharacterized protein